MFFCTVKGEAVPTVKMVVAGWAVESGFVRSGTTFGLLACFTATALTWVVAEVVMVKAFVARVTKILSF